LIFYNKIHTLNLYSSPNILDKKNNFHVQLF
jgi:hypothetical protein